MASRCAETPGRGESSPATRRTSPETTIPLNGGKAGTARFPHRSVARPCRASRHRRTSHPSPGMDQRFGFYVSLLGLVVLLVFFQPLAAEQRYSLLYSYLLYSPLLSSGSAHVQHVHHLCVARALHGHYW